ncbi:TetR/AcrR family transcriptional regulator [Demequina aurantiaca]|uniref:TetR/AcrR family transcriptional regulator n=1 Tax=Demequina aurantiaca TaxID=676200 RepID=UPI003D3416F4
MSPTATAILDAARGALLETGYASLSTRKVAERAGVPLSQIHYHFGSKENLVLELLDTENAKLVGRQAAMYAGDEPLAVQWVRACDYLDDDLASGYVRILHELLAAGLSHEVIGKRVRAMLDAWGAVLTEAFASHEARGVDFSPFTVPQLAALASASFLGAEAIILAGQEDDTLPVRDALRAVGALIATAEAAAASSASTTPAGARS